MSSRNGKLDDYTFQWLDRQPNGRVTACDKCHRRVWPEEPRMQYHDGQGKYQAKGTSSSYWCTDCAAKRGIIAPIPEKLGVQEGLFDGS